MWSATRLFLNARPTCIYCIAPAARTPPSFFFLLLLLKNVSLFALNICLLQKNSGRQLFREEAVAGRICIGCAGFIRKIGNAAFPWGRTRSDVPSALSRPTRRLNCARPATRSWRAQPDLRAISQGRRVSSQKVSESGVSFYFCAL